MSFEMEDLSFSTVELVKSLLAASPEFSAPTVSEDLLVRYAFGWATETDEGTVMEALIRSGDLRRQLIGIRASLAHADSRTECVRRFLDHAVEVSVTALDALERGLGDWKYSFEQTLVVRSAIRALASRSSMGSSGLALTRSAVSHSVEDSSELFMTLGVEVTEDGQLHVWGKSADGRGRTVFLEIMDEVWGAIPLGAAKPIGGEWRILVNEFGDWDANRLASTRLQTRIADEPPSHDLDAIMLQTEDGHFARCPLSAPPSIVARNLNIKVALDSEFRSRYAGQVLSMSLNAGPLSIPLRSWPVSRLPEDGHLVAPIPCSLEGPLPRAAIILALRTA